MKIYFIVLFAMTWLSVAFAEQTLTESCHGQKTKLKKIGNHNKRFEALSTFIWSQWMIQSPEMATRFGYPGLDDQWSDQSPTGRANEKELAECHLGLVRLIDSRKLNSSNSLNLRLLQRRVQTSIESLSYPNELYSLHQTSGPQIDIVSMMEFAPKKSLQDFSNRIGRLRNFEKLIDQSIETLEKNLKLGISLPAFLITPVVGQIGDLSVDPERNPILRPFLQMPSSISKADREQILAEARSIITTSVIPALAKLKTYLTETYIPKARSSTDLGSLPNGRDWYRALLREYTTTDLSPEKIHQIGLDEVDRINLRMEEIRQQVGFKGSADEFHHFLKTDPQFFYSNPQDLLNGYKVIAKSIDPELPRLFGKLPSLPYGVREMAPFKAKSAPTAYYMQGNLLTGQPGYFEANTFNLPSRPKWEMEVLTVHESVPGHHLQISIGQELEGLPEFRKLGNTAFIEGWGLYSESLGSELGLYKDPYSLYGMHTYDMWRAVRLVVDTGLHYFGWSKERALAYFMKNVPKDRLQSEVEIDRYISWPGQAAAYKIGQLQISELKAFAKSRLGENFDVREFHDQILKNGSLPLDILDQELKTWVGTKSSP